jgi:hypothetical protein
MVYHFKLKMVYHMTTDIEYLQYHTRIYIYPYLHTIYLFI